MARQTYSGIVRAHRIILCALMLILCDPARVLAAPSQTGQVAYELH
jgi:hypothetical protein